MSLDLFRQDLEERLSGFGGTKELEPGMFDGFVRGTALYTMRGFAKTARAIDMAGAVFPVIQDAITGGTAARDQYFREHDEVFGGAVDYWTPKPLEVGAAAEVVGSLVSQLPVIIANPHLAVGAQVLDTAEDLTAKGVMPGKAVTAGVIQGAGLAAGIWMPVLGRNYLERVLVGGAGANLLQGVVTRGATQLVLEGTPAEKDFQAIEGKAMTLDVLLGLMFGNLVHLSPAQRAQGAEAWTRIQRWAEKATPSERAAVATLRTAQHLNEDSLPGRADSPADVEAHVQRTRAAIDQLARDERVEVEGLPEPKVEADDARFKAAARRTERLRQEGVRIAEFYDFVDADPAAGSAADRVRITSEEIGKVLIERGDAWREGLEIKHGEYGLVKVMFRHGPRSEKPRDVQVTKADVERLPEVMDEWVPIKDHTRKDGKRILEWQVPREDGKSVMYVLSRFADHQEPTLITMFVNERKNESFRKKPMSVRREVPESPGGGSKPRSDAAAPGTGDTSPELSSRRPDGQDAASVRTEGPAGQPSGAEPPPPRGARAEKPAGPEAEKPEDPLALEAARVAAELPDLQIRVGTDPEGKPIVKSAAEFLAEADAGVKALEEEQNLVRAAAACLLGVA